MAYRQPFTYSELLNDLTEVISLVSVTFAGRTFYWASRPITIESREVGPIQFQGGLDADWQDALSLFNDSPPLVSLSLDLYFPLDVDIAELVAKGHDLSLAVGEFSLYPLSPDQPTRLYEERVTIFQGTVRQPQYGEKGQPIAFSLEANPFEDTALIPEPAASVNFDTWPDHDPNVTNRVYPTVFGTPGVYQDSTGAEQIVPGSPAFGVEIAPAAPNLVQKVLVAGHKVAANRVTLWGTDTAGNFVSSVQDVVTETDGLGREVSVIDGILGPLLPAGGALWVTWNQFPLAGGLGRGGLINDRYTGTRTGAGEVIDYFLRLSTLKLDVGKWNVAADYLNRYYKLSGYVDEEVSPWEYVKENFIQILPLSLIATEGGLAPVVWRRDAKKADAVAHLTEGANMARVSAVNYERQKIKNEIRISFAPSADEDKYNSTAAVVTRPTGVSGQFTTEYSRASGIRYGTIPEVLESEVIFESSTASEVLQWKHRANCFPYRTVSYRAAIRFGFLTRGDLVTLTDPALHFDRYLAMIRDVEWDNGRPVLTFVLIDDPPREDRP